MKILMNPDSPKGARIHDINPLGGKTYFTEGDAFEPGTLFQFEDDQVADALMERYGFLFEMSPDDAKRFLAMDKMKCPECGYETRVKTEYDKHLIEHKKAHELSDLGIPVIKSSKSFDINETADEDKETQRVIDKEGASDGLEGIGLQDDRPTKNVVMS